MTFDQVDFFMSCAACLNFSLASKYHFVSVSTLSRSVSAMEDELGVKLFERGYHGHKLTDAGRDFFECCINNSIELNKYLIKWSKSSRDYVHIGCHPYDGSFERIINAYYKAPSDYLSKKIKIFFIPEGRMEKALDAGYICAAVERRSNAISDTVCSVHPFCKSDGQEYVLCLRNDLDESLAVKLIRLGSFLK